VLIAGAITLWNDFKLPDIEAANLEKMARRTDKRIISPSTPQLVQLFT